MASSKQLLVLLLAAAAAMAHGADVAAPEPGPAGGNSWGTATLPSTRDACPGTSARAGFVGGWQTVTRQDPLLAEAMQVCVLRERACDACACGTLHTRTAADMRVPAY